MHDRPRTVERQCDVAVVGGSAAGLAAALQLGRQRRSVIVVDAGDPRNAPADHMHGFLGREGVPPTELIAAGREEVRSYGGEILPGRVSEVRRGDDGRFRLELLGGHAVVARRVLAATGLADELPEIDGLAKHWGRDVIHCPFCHGYEARDRRIVGIVTHPRGLHTAGLFRQLTGRLTLVIQDGAEADETELAGLQESGVAIRRGPVSRVVTGEDGRLAAVELADGERLAADAVTVGPRFRARAESFLPLGLHPAPHPSGLGDHLATDVTGATDIPGVYAAGNVADPSQQVLQAAADGARVGTMISFSLAGEDIRAAARPSANEADWDRRYSGVQMWSGNPNGALVTEIDGMPPARALDVGAGEGGDALWLAGQGWDVTASDISRRALDRIAAEAGRRGLHVGLHHADANGLAPYEPEAFDLVLAMYASIPRTPDARGVRNLLDAVAPGGLLLVVSHDLEPMRAPVDTRTRSRAFDPDAYVRTEDFAEALTSSPGWEIDAHELRPRPPGASAAASHHVDDIVLRARRGAEDPGVPFTHRNLKDDPEDLGSNFNGAPGLEFRAATAALQLERSGLTYQRIPPGYRFPYGHTHRTQEEVYVVVGGGGRMKLDDEVVELRQWDAVRVPPGTWRGYEAGAEGLEILVVGAPSLGDAPRDDVEGRRDWWTD